MSGQPFHWSILISLLGVYLLTTEQLKEVKPEKEAFENEEHKENYHYEGFWMIFLAALTEAIIYFQVRNIKTDNNWNHVFISYFFGAVVMLFYVLFYQQTLIQDILLQKQFTIAIMINAVIGTLGYYFRFYAATRIEPILYAFLSYFGIFMSFVYGVIFNKDVITWKKIIGVLLIVVSNFYIILQKYKKA
jgi:drug/metabolite transporter (DMT)-like permease